MELNELSGRPSVVLIMLAGRVAAERASAEARHGQSPDTAPAAPHVVMDRVRVVLPCGS